MRCLELNWTKGFMQRGILIGVSGGVDSIVLLDLTMRRLEYFGLAKNRVIVAHCNYRLRSEADTDETLVRRTANGYGVVCEIIRPEPPTPRHNLQAWARRTRYSFFEQVAQNNKLGIVAVAHHLDDQVETVLWHLLRGSGLSGMRGMNRERRLSDRVMLHRPLLEYSREEIIAYANERRLQWNEDTSNQAIKYTRNRLRNKLIPMLERLNNGAVRHIAAFAAKARTDEDYLQGVARDFLQAEQIASPSGEVRWNRRAFLSEHQAIRVRILQLAYASIVGEGVRLMEDHLQRMNELAEGGGRIYSLPGSACFRREGEYCIIEINQRRAGIALETVSC